MIIWIRWTGEYMTIDPDFFFDAVIVAENSSYKTLIYFGY